MDGPDQNSAKDRASDLYIFVWQDALGGHQIRVVAMKADSGPTLCLKCFYIKRGSFGGLKIGEFVELLHANPPLREKRPSCFY